MRDGLKSWKRKCGVVQCCYLCRFLFFTPKGVGMTDICEDNRKCALCSNESLHSDGRYYAPAYRSHWRTAGCIYLKTGSCRSGKAWTVRNAVLARQKPHAKKPGQKNENQWPDAIDEKLRQFTDIRKDLRGSTRCCHNDICRKQIGCGYAGFGFLRGMGGYMPSRHSFMVVFGG